MLSTQRIVTTWIGALLALVSAPTGAAFASSGAVWGYQPPAAPLTSCSLDAPYSEQAYTTDGDNNAGECPAYPPPQANAPRCGGPYPVCAASGVCGVEVLQENKNGCTGGGCCKAGSVSPDGVVDVLPYLERPAGRPLSADPAVDDDNEIDDSPGIATAIECAGATMTARRTVAFPAGRYVLRTPLRPQYPDLTLQGPDLSPDATPGDPGTATLVALPCNPEQFPGAIQVSKTSGNIVQPVSGVWIRNFQIALTDGPRTKANSGVQINNCSDCLVENIIMRYEPLVEPQRPYCKPSNLDGITFAVGSGGTIRNVIVDGTPKGGIYLASAFDPYGTPPGTPPPIPPAVTVENCEIKNINGPVGASGIKIVAPNVTVRNCEVHHSLLHPTSGSGGHGLFISTQIVPNVGYAVPHHVTVEDSYFHHNGTSGVLMASVVADRRPEHITLDRVSFAYNGNHGVHIQAGDEVTLRDVWSWGNGFYGMYLTSRTPLAPTSLRVGSVFMEDPLVVNNGLLLNLAAPGILLEASHVTIDGGEVAHCDPSPPTSPTSPTRGKQLRSVVQRCWSEGSNSGQTVFYPVNNVISGLITSTTSATEMPACTL
ncbi:right-handed parallel beta-helix repeat-containing protein [Sorangium sp. So ce388]|uniref:right-handed parallel beta-helix repeat-containing protein n=1 Tax=Sorangium sp. So ce388 TaxID=3133309 RepID=UPI003F5CAA92